MTNRSIQELKDLGFMKQSKRDSYVLRVKVTGGYVTAEELQAVQDIATKFGNGQVHMTSRQSIEIPFLKKENLDQVIETMEKTGLKPGACGAKVRTITACQGSTVCNSGLIDTLALAEEFDKRYFGRKMPHKFKIGITGCRNNCLKAEENDIGVKGAMNPTWNFDACTFCGACQAVCRDNAIEIDKENQTLTIDAEACVQCGRCVKKCPTGAMTGESGFIVYFGGRFGNKIQIGRQLLPTIYDEEKLHEVIEVTLAFFQKHGKAKERFSAMLERVGWDLFESELKKL